MNERGGVLRNSLTYEGGLNSARLSDNRPIKKMVTISNEINFMGIMGKNGDIKEPPKRRTPEGQCPRRKKSHVEDIPEGNTSFDEISPRTVPPSRQKYMLH